MNSSIKTQLREIATERMSLQDKLIAAQVWQTCLNCVHWHKRTEVDMRADPPTRNETANCDLFNAMPPPHIIVSGCPDHENDIPF